MHKAMINSLTNLFKRNDSWGESLYAPKHAACKPAARLHKIVVKPFIVSSYLLSVFDWIRNCSLFVSSNRSNFNYNELSYKNNIKLTDVPSYPSPPTFTFYHFRKSYIDIRFYLIFWL